MILPSHIKIFGSVTADSSVLSFKKSLKSYFSTSASRNRKSGHYCRYSEIRIASKFSYQISSKSCMLNAAIAVSRQHCVREHHIFGNRIVLNMHPIQRISA